MTVIGLIISPFDFFHKLLCLNLPVVEVVVRGSQSCYKDVDCNVPRSKHVKNPKGVQIQNIKNIFEKKKSKRLRHPGRFSKEILNQLELTLPV